MESDLLSAPRILLVEHDPALQSLLGEILGREGYVVSVAGSLAEVSTQLTQETYDLVLADVYVGRAHPGSFTPAHQLRRQVSPTPVGLLMTLPFTPEEAQRAGFAFVVPMPFDLDELMAQVASVLQPSFDTEHAQQVQIVEHFFTAREYEDWPAALALCTEDVVSYPLGTSNSGTARRMQGLLALRLHLTSATHAVHGQVFLHRSYAMLPKGLAAWYVRLWTTPEGELRREANIALFHFRGMRICQVGMRPLVSHRQEQAQTG